MGRKPVKKPTVGHLWTVSPLPLLDIGMSIGMLGNININVNVRGEHVQTKSEPLTPERVPPPDVVYPTTLPS